MIWLQKRNWLMLSRRPRHRKLGFWASHQLDETFERTRSNKNSLASRKWNDVIVVHWTVNSNDRSTRRAQHWCCARAKQKKREQNRCAWVIRWHCLQTSSLPLIIGRLHVLLTCIEVCIWLCDRHRSPLPWTGADFWTLSLYSSTYSLSSKIGFTSNGERKKYIFSELKLKNAHSFLLRSN